MIGHHDCKMAEGVSGQAQAKRPEKARPQVQEGERGQSFEVSEGTKGHAVNKVRNRGLFEVGKRYIPDKVQHKERHFLHVT